MPYAKANYVDHNLTDQSSILRFVENNWGLGRIGDQSMNAIAGSMNGLFNFQIGAALAKAVLLDPTSGNPLSTVRSTTTAVANPKATSTVAKQLTLDGTSSVSFDGNPRTFAWTAAPGTPAAAMEGSNSATRTVQFASGSGTCSFVLTVTESTGATATDTASIT